MPFSGDTFTKLYSWLTDPQRNEKIFNSRLDDEFGGIAAGLTTLGGRSTALETDVSTAEDDINALQAAVAGLGGGGTPASFSAHKNGTDQTGIADLTFTQITFGTEVYDVGGYFSSSAWTPPAGKVSLNVTCFMTGTVTVGSICLVAIYKNGVIFKQGIIGAGSDISGGSAATVTDDIANGSDVYTAYVFVNVDSGTATVLGLSRQTWFSGHWFSA